MEQRKIILKFNGVEVELISYAIDEHSAFDKERGGSYEGTISMAFPLSSGPNALEPMKYQYVRAGLTIENGFTGETIHRPHCALVSTSAIAFSSCSVQELTFKLYIN